VTRFETVGIEEIGRDGHRGRGIGDRYRESDRYFDSALSWTETNAAPSVSNRVISPENQ